MKGEGTALQDDIQVNLMTTISESDVTNQMTGDAPTAESVLIHFIFTRLLMVCRASVTTNEESYQCKWLIGHTPCDHKFPTLDELSDHLSHVHGVRGHRKRKLVCRWWTNEGSCDKRCRRDGFRRHIQTHLGHFVSCSECGKFFARADTLRVHFRKKHEGKSFLLEPPGRTIVDGSSLDVTPYPFLQSYDGEPSESFFWPLEYTSMFEDYSILSRNV